MLRIALITVGLFLLLAGSAAAEELVVIVNKDNKTNVDRQLIQKIYQGDVSRWPSGGVVAALDQPEDSPIAAQFAAKVIGKPLAALKDIWAHNIFTGKAMPPKVHSSEETIKKIVGRSKNAIGYIKASSVDSSVKVVLTVP